MFIMIVELHHEAARLQKDGYKKELDELKKRVSNVREKFEATPEGSYSRMVMSLTLKREELHFAKVLFLCFNQTGFSSDTETFCTF